MRAPRAPFYFNPRPPCGGRPSQPPWSVGSSSDFNPRPPCGGRRVYGAVVRDQENFNPRPPCGGRRSQRPSRPGWQRFQSTPPVWGATILAQSPDAIGDCISIHAPRVGGDWRICAGRTCPPYFNPRPPVWGATQALYPLKGAVAISIHAPRVGGDRRSAGNPARGTDFNPRPPCGGRRWGLQRPHYLPEISIHAPRVGGDYTFKLENVEVLISIHAPRVGGDRSRGRFLFHSPNFNPRPPCGGRRGTLPEDTAAGTFQSTPPVWGATLREIKEVRIPAISIHAPRVGGDRKTAPRRKKWG